MSQEFILDRKVVFYNYQSGKALGKLKKKTLGTG